MRDGSGYSEGGASTVCAGQCGRGPSVRGRLRRGAPPCRRASGRASVGVDDVLLLVARRPDRKAVDHVGTRETEQLAHQVSTLSRRHRGAESTADLLVDLLVGDDPARNGPLSEQLISRYERYIACARQPALRDVQRRIMKQRTDAVVEVVERSGRSVHTELLTALVCAVDGAVVASMVGIGPGPHATARATLVDVIDVLAPFD